MILTIPRATPSLNELHGKHWTTKHKIKQQWRVLIWNALATQLQTPDYKARGKRTLTIKRHGKRSLDVDNLYGGCKIVIDLLRDFGLLVDDDAKNIILTASNEKLGKGEEPHTVLILEDVQ